jgi:hypothetical protein
LFGGSAGAVWRNADDAWLISLISAKGCAETNIEQRYCSGEKVVILYKSRRVHGLIGRSMTLVLSVCLCALAQRAPEKAAPADATPILWQEPSDIATRNLLLGPGGEVMQPDLSSVTFIEKQKGGHSTKYRVRDAQGRVWVAKVGKEAQSEVAASRLLWAVGYFTDITYLAPRVEIQGKGTFENVRFEARPKQIKRLEEWTWEQNPFSGTPEFQGLKVMMLLLGNWDIKDSNNRILLVQDEQTGDNRLRYIVSDLGSTFGKTSGLFTGTRSEPRDYLKAKFVLGVKGDRVEFNYAGKRGNLFHDITVTQAGWIGDRLARLSERQIRDAFRAANYREEEVSLLTKAVQARINELVALNRTVASGEKRGPRN